MEGSGRVEIIVLITFVLICNTFNVTYQKLYKTVWQQSGALFGGAACMLGGSVLIEDKRGAFTSEDIALLNRESIRGCDQGTVGKF